MELKHALTRNIKLGPFVSTSDGYTPLTNLAGTLQVLISKNGGAFARRNSITAIAHDPVGSGYYTVELNSTDLNTFGPLQVVGSGYGTSLVTWQNYNVVSSGYWNNKYDDLGVSIANNQRVFASGLNWGGLTGTTTAVNLSNTLFSTSNAVAAVTGGVTVTTNSDKTGYTTTSADKNAVAATVYASGVSLATNVSGIVQVSDELQTQFNNIELYASGVNTRVTTARAGYLDNLNIGTLVQPSGASATVDPDQIAAVVYASGVSNVSVNANQIASVVYASGVSRLDDTIQVSGDIIITNLSAIAAEVYSSGVSNVSVDTGAIVAALIASGVPTDKTGYSLLSSEHQLNAWFNAQSGINLHGNGAWTTAIGFSTFNPSTTPVTISGNYDKSGYSLVTSPPTANQIAAVVNATGISISDLASTIYNQTSGVLQNFRLNELIYQNGDVPNSGSLLGRLTERNGDVDRFTEAALALGPTSSGGSTPASIWAYSDRTLTGPVAISGNYDKTDYTLTTADKQILAWFDAQSGINLHGTGGWTTAIGFSTFNPATTPVTVSGNYDKSGYSLLTTLPTANQIASVTLASGVGLETSIQTMLSRLTSARAGYLDNLNIGGLVQPSGSTVNAGQIAAVLIASGVALETTLNNIISSGINLSDNENVYFADIHFTKDDTNSRDEYEVVWYKNGSPADASISTNIHVVSRGGLDLVSATAMTEILNGVSIYNESSNRVTAGDAVMCEVSGVIDGAYRTSRRWVGRDGS